MGVSRVVGFILLPVFWCSRSTLIGSLLSEDDDATSTEASLTYNETQAKFFARLAQVSFCDAESIQLWSCGEPCEGSGIKPPVVRMLFEGTAHGVQGFVAVLPDHVPALPAANPRTRRCVVSFRGSNNMKNWLADARVWTRKLDDTPEAKWCPAGCEVHRGFRSAYHELRTHLYGAVLGSFKCKEVHFVGHSLGAAVATLAAADFRGSDEMRGVGVRIPPAWLFGPPQVGNAAFAAAFAALVRADEQPGSIRIINQYDVVPSLAAAANPMYKHVGPEVVYLPDGTYVVCDAPDQPACARPRLNTRDFWSNQAPANHVLYLGINYAAKFLPGACLQKNRESRVRQWARGRSRI
eukprot:TRINITY_DN5707_c0_g2_i1.p1 TRINITY_DN5707_c0_g2~~TRINITY_DN5707_c0_g2_i1.p1  ORF type:complete len:366 (-),score=50.19 TRINITY_DN5707_c0_g2_i1:339-1394(-)